MLELLGIGALLVKEVALAATERGHHRLGPAGVDGADRGQVEALLEQRIAQHRARLYAMHVHHIPAEQIAPGERFLGAARGDHEPVALIDLGEVHHGWPHALLEERPARGNRGLGHMGLIGRKRTDDVAVCGNAEIAALEAFALQESLRHGGDQRTVESRMA